MPDLISRTIAKRYRIISFLGKGGMAEVYQVWDEARSVPLAMKILHADLAEDKVFLRRFKREAQTLAKLQHPNIVRFYGLEQADGLVFILIEYVEGTTLRKEIFETDKPLTMQRILQVMRPVCAALNYAHKSGFVHCDVKPANIMLHKNGTVYVADFGIARMTETATVTMVGAGTPAYMSPEQVRGETPMPQTDIYALGIILFEMLTGGERPFTGENAKTGGSTSEKIRWEQMCLAPPPPSKFNHLITPKMDRIILKCLEKKPENRYPDVSVLLNALESAVRDDLPEPAIRIARPQQVNRDTLVTQPGENINNPIRRQQLSAVTAVVSLVFILGIVSALWIFGIAWKQRNATQAPILYTPPISSEPVLTTPITTIPASAPTEATTPTITQTSTNIIPTVAKTDITPSTIPPKTPQTGTDKSKVVTETCPDGSKVAPGTKFTKTWDIKNVGSNTWNKSYTLVFFSSEPTNMTMGSPPRIPFPQDVLPETVVTLSVPLTAPSDLGFYKVSWKLENDRNEPIAIGTSQTLYISIQVDLTGNTTCP